MTSRAHVSCNVTADHDLPNVRSDVKSVRIALLTCEGSTPLWCWTTSSRKVVFPTFASSTRAPEEWSSPSNTRPLPLQVSRSLLAFFSAETVRLILLRRFGHLSHSCIKTRHDSVFLAYIFKHSERNDLIFFGLFKNVSVYDAKKTKPLISSVRSILVSFGCNYFSIRHKTILSKTWQVRRRQTFSWNFWEKEFCSLSSFLPVSSMSNAFFVYNTHKNMLGRQDPDLTTWFYPQILGSTMIDVSSCAGRGSRFLYRQLPGLGKSPLHISPLHRDVVALIKKVWERTQKN